MKKLILILILSFLPILSSKGEEPQKSSDQEWKKEADMGLTLTQNSYSDNWIGGEAGSVNWVSLANFSAEKQLSTKINTNNTLKLSFGQTHTQDEKTKHWSKPRKSTDLIDFNSILRLTLKAFVDPYVAVRAETQFWDAADTTTKRYFNPLKLTETAGAAKMIYKVDKTEFLTRLGFGIRQNIDRKRDPEVTKDGGLESVTDFKTILAKDNIKYTFKLTLFRALFYSEADKLKGEPNQDYWKALDVNWENTLVAGITKYLTVNLYLQLLYDKEISLKGRFKETLSLGFSYKFF